MGSEMCIRDRLILVETFVMVVAYLGLSALFRLEAFTYLVSTAHEFLTAKGRTR